MTSSKIWVWKKVPGLVGRYNDIIYSRPVLPPSQDFLVYFGGDVQDIQENMVKHTDSKKYTEWSLENTADILSTNFPNKHIVIVRPSRMHETKNAMFSCFDNFVPGNEHGVPSFNPIHNALEHLQNLIKSTLEYIETSSAESEITYSKNEEPKLTLMGFSKGCVVLNQLLHEFYHCQSKTEPDVKGNNFIKLIQSMWWLDGGHGGSKNTWITEKLILESFAKLKIHVYVHVTPYQIKDPHRPWIGSEESCFCGTLQSMGIPIVRTLHFADQSPNLKAHFNVLKVVRSCTK